MTKIVGNDHSGHGLSAVRDIHVNLSISINHSAQLERERKTMPAIEANKWGEGAREKLVHW